LFSKILIFAVPLALSGILQLLYNAADLIICEMFSEVDSTAAISSTNSLTNLIITLFMGLSVGANVLVARYYGEKNRERAQEVVYTSMILSVIVGVVIGIFGFVFSSTFLKWMNTPADVIDLSSTYLKIYFLGLPFSMIYNFGSALFRAVGDTKKPFIFLAIAGLFNVLFNLLFVIVFNMDVDGVALGTIISQGISALFVVIALFRYKGFFNFSLKEMKFSKEAAIDIARIGIPSGIQGVIFSISNVLIQSSVNELGTDVMGGSGAANSLEGFIYTAMNSVAQASVAFVSANYGAGNKKNIKKVFLYSLFYVFCMNIIMGSIVLVLENFLLGLYVDSEAAIEAGRQRIKMIALTYFLCGFMDVGAQSSRGLGYSIRPTIISMCGVCGIRLLWVFVIFKLDSFHNLNGLVISYPISWLLTSALQAISFAVAYKKLNFDVKIANESLEAIQA
jgi:putative MATE family efflux protein